MKECSSPNTRSIAPLSARCENPRAIPSPRPHGSLLAADVGELVGVSGTTIGQWARRGYIRSSQSPADPRVYSVEDVAEASAVRALIERGVRRPDVRRTVERLRGPD